MSNKTQNLFKNQSKSNKANTISEQIKFSSRKMNQICKSLSFPVDKYNVINTIESISGYLTNDKKIERLLYSEISSYVYSLSEDGVATFLSNTEKLLTYVLDKEHDIDENIVKVCIKIYDHTQLIITQISNVNMIARKEIVKNMRDEKIKLHDEVKEIQRIKKYTRLEKEANALFGTMRDATPEEQASVNKYIKNISKNTGVKFFDLC